MRKKLAFIVIASTFFLSASVYAETLGLASSPSGTPISTVTSSTYGSTIEFGSVTIDVTQSTFVAPIQAIDYLRIDDSRQTNEGWNIKVSASNFIAIVQDKTSVVDTDTVMINIPVDRILSFTATDPVGLDGSIVDPLLMTATTIPTPVPKTGQETSILTAASGSGAGSYSTDVTYTLFFPNYLPTGSTVTPSSPTNSKFDDYLGVEPDPTYDQKVQTLQIFAGQYSATITYSIIQAP